MCALLSALIIASLAGGISLALIERGKQKEVAAAYEIGSKWFIYHIAMPCYLAILLAGFWQKPNKGWWELATFLLLFGIVALVNLGVSGLISAVNTLKTRVTVKALSFSCNTSIPIFQAEACFNLEQQGRFGALLVGVQIMTNLLIVCILVPVLRLKDGLLGHKRHGKRLPCLDWRLQLALTPGVLALPMGAILVAIGCCLQPNPIEMAVRQVHNSYATLALVAVGTGIALLIAQELEVKGRQVSFQAAFSYILAESLNPKCMKLVAVKQVLQPALLYILGCLCGLPAELTKMLVMLSATPTSSGGGILVECMGGSKTVQKKLMLVSYSWCLLSMPLMHLVLGI